MIATIPPGYGKSRVQRKPASMGPSYLVCQRNGSFGEAGEPKLTLRRIAQRQRFVPKGSRRRQLRAEGARLVEVCAQKPFHFCPCWVGLYSSMIPAAANIDICLIAMRD